MVLHDYFKRKKAAKKKEKVRRCKLTPNALFIFPKDYGINERLCFAQPFTGCAGLYSVSFW
jgi:hypothetical protein